MTEHREKEPDLGRLDAVDDSPTNVASLRTERSEPDPAPPLSVAPGLTSRDQPAPSPSTEDGGEPGNSLRRAREAAGMDIAALASRINLGRGTLEDLEANRFEHMPPAYVRGYLRSCARELGVDADPWILAFERHGLSDPELRAVATRPGRSSQPRRTRGIYWLTFLLILLLLGLGAYSWTDHNGMSLLPSLDPGAPEDAASGAASPRAPGATPSTPPNRERTGVPEPSPGHRSEVATPRPETREGGTTNGSTQAGSEGDAASAERIVTPDALTETLAAASDSGADEGTASDDAAATSAATPLSQANPETSTPAAVSDEPVLALEFSSTSWVEVRDAAGEVVLSGILSAGDREELRLQLPARVVLGNAAGVSLQLDGEPVDIQPHVRDDRTARFDLEG